MRNLLSLLSVVCVLFFYSPAHAEGENSNIRFSPLGLLVGAVSVNFDFAISESWTFGPQLLYWHFDPDAVGFSTGISIDGYGGGLRANWYTSGVHSSGFYFAPSLNYLSAEAEYTEPGYTDTGSTSGVNATALVGYGWFWDSFNILLGVGYSAALTNNDFELRLSNGQTLVQSSSSSSFAGEFSFGFTF